MSDVWVHWTQYPAKLRIWKGQGAKCETLEWDEDSQRMLIRVTRLSWHKQHARERFAAGLGDVD